MKYYLFAQFSGTSSSESKVFEFNSAELRAKAQTAFERSRTYPTFVSFENSSNTLDEIFLRLLEADPISIPDLVFERAKEAFNLLQAKRAN